MHLQSHQHYIDRYDKLTVDTCRLHEKIFKERTAELSADDPEYAMKKSATEAALRVGMYFCVGEEAIRKEKTIAGWMEKDRRSDSLEENAVAPTGIECLHCGKAMESTFKTLDYNERVLFFYDCPNNCVPRRCFYDNGEEWLRKPDPCTKCGADTKNKTVRKGKDLFSTWKFPLQKQPLSKPKDCYINSFVPSLFFMPLIGNRT